MTKEWVQVATIGAKAGTDLKDSSGNVLADTAVKNSSIALALSGTGLTLTNAGSGVTLSNASVGLSNVANVDMRDLGNATAGTLAAARGGTGLTSISTLTNSNTTKSDVGLGNVDNDSTATIRSGTTAANVGLGNVDNNSTATILGSTHTGAVSGNVTGTVNNVAVATVTSGAALGASSNQDSTATIRNGVTTYAIDKAAVIIWSNLNGNMTPNDTTWDWTITWRNGSGTSLGTTVIRTSLNGTTALSGMSTQSNGASATVNLGGATSSGSFQTTTVTKNSVAVTLSAKIIDGSGWDFK